MSNWYRITGVGNPGALHCGLGILPGQADELYGRLHEGFAAYYSGLLADDEGLRVGGYSVEPMHTAPARISISDQALATAYSRLKNIAEKIAPESLNRLRGPALAEDVDILERLVGQSLPSSLMAWLSLHDGGRGPFDWEMSTVVEIASTRKMLEGFATNGTFEAGWYSSRWLPFANNGAGDHLCIDLEQGTIIEYLHDHEAREIRTSSLPEWIETTAKALENGELVATELRGEYFGVLPRNSLRGSLATLVVRGESKADRQARLDIALFANPPAFAVEIFERMESKGLIRLKPRVKPMLRVLPALANALAEKRDLVGLIDALTHAMRIGRSEKQQVG